MTPSEFEDYLSHLTDEQYDTFDIENNANLSFIGFEVHDKLYGYIGIIENILEYPGQEIFEIRGLSKEEILIPFNENFIEKISKIKKKIFVVTPEGLLDLYLKKPDVDFE